MGARGAARRGVELHAEAGVDGQVVGDQDVTGAVVRERDLQILEKCNQEGE